MKHDNRELINGRLVNEMAINRLNYQYFFFSVSSWEYELLCSAAIRFKIISNKAIVVLNSYLGKVPEYELEEGVQEISVSKENIEKGENILAFKGQIQVLEVNCFDEAGEIITEKNKKSDPIEHLDAGDPYADGLEFLLNMEISGPTNSPFIGSEYCIYDYTNHCYRMPQWLWSDAPAVSVLIDAIRSNRYPAYKERMEKLAGGICETFLRTQILDEREDSYGAYVSRYRYYSSSDHPFKRLLGPNDTSFSVKWAVLPWYEYTGDERFLKSAEVALKWVERVIRSNPFVPSHYYFDNKTWEDRAFVDTGFVAEGFQKYDEVLKERCYTELMDFVMNRYLKQFRLESGFFGQDYLPGKGVTDVIFARGQAWALEGMLACVREGIHTEKYMHEARRIADLVIKSQNPSGSWSWSLGKSIPDQVIQEQSGECEKGTAALAYLLTELYRLTLDDKYKTSAQQAILWCEDHMQIHATEGYGGIASESVASGITGLPFLKTATGYANSFYLLAKNNMLKADVNDPKWN